MNKQEIEQAANECADSFGSMEPCIAKIKQDVAARSYVLGATMVNEKQPYTPDDMQSFWIWAYNNGWDYGELTEGWYHCDQMDDTKHTIEEVLKIWEDLKAKRGDNGMTITVWRLLSCFFADFETINLNICRKFTLHQIIHTRMMGV